MAVNLGQRLPFAGKEGSKVTSTMIRELMAEAEVNVAITYKESETRTP